MKIFLILIKVLVFLKIFPQLQSQNTEVNDKIIETQQDLIEEQRLFENAIDIPQKIKVEVSLNPKQFKYLKININNVIKHNSFTAYIYTLKGLALLNANLCADEKVIMPTQNQYDFRFGLLQTQLKTKTILHKLNQKNIDQNNNVYLCIIAYSQEQTKFQIQYTSTKDIIEMLSLYKFQKVKTEKNISKFYQVQASVQKLIKIVRKSGTPYVLIKICTGKDISFEKCLQDIIQQKIQFANIQPIYQNKTYEYESCFNCIVYLKISSQEPTEIEIHLEPIYQELNGNNHRKNFIFQSYTIIVIIFVLSIGYYSLFYRIQKLAYGGNHITYLDDQQKYCLSPNVQ